MISQFFKFLYLVQSWALSLYSPPFSLYPYEPQTLSPYEPLGRSQQHQMSTKQGYRSEIFYSFLSNIGNKVKKLFSAPTPDFDLSPKLLSTPTP